MKALFTGIYGKFTGSALATALSGKMYPDEAPQDTALPYATYSQPSGTPDYWLGGEQHESILIQFDIYHSTHDGVCDLYDLLRALYDDAALTVTGYSCLKFEREFSQKIKEDHCWRYIVEYRALLQKT